MFKRTASFLLATALTVSMCQIAGGSTTQAKTVPQTANIERKQTLSRVDEVQSDLVEFLQNKNATYANSEQLIQQFFKQNKKVNARDLQAINEIDKADTMIKQISAYTTRSLAESKITKEHTINDFKLEFLMNGCFSIEPIQKESTSRIVKRAATQNKWGQAYKDYYNYFGGRTFTVAVGCGFKYDGSTAGYYGNFNAYYKKGTLTIWQVSNWEKGHEQQGSSYEAHCSGNFHFGFEYDGNGAVIQDLFVTHRVTCDSDGNIEPYFDLVE